MISFHLRSLPSFIFNVGCMVFNVELVLSREEFSSSEGQSSIKGIPSSREESFPLFCFNGLP